MKNINLLLVAILLSVSIVNAQKVDKKQKVDKDHMNYFKTPTDISNSEYNLSFSDIVARFDLCKLAVKVTNNTSDFIIFKKGECVFGFDFGEFNEKKKDIVIKPHGSKRRVLEANGGDQFHVEKFNLELRGFYLVPVNGKVNEIEDFMVPPSKNSIDTDLFSISLKKYSLKTAESSLQFECIYNGDKIAFIDPSKITIKVDGTDKEYANDNKKGGGEMLMPGDKVNIKAVFHIPGKIADMQFANMTISWKDTFIETEAKKIAHARTIMRTNA